MTWNHRLVKMKDGEDTVMLICEVYYDSNGKPIMRNEGARAMGATHEELRTVLAQMARALEQPALEEADFTEKKG